MSQINDAAAHATLLICDDGPKQAWRWHKHDFKFFLVVGIRNLLSKAVKEVMRLLLKE